MSAVLKTSKFFCKILCVRISILLLSDDQSSLFGRKCCKIILTKTFQPRFLVRFVLLHLQFYMYVLSIVVCPFVVFLLAIVLSVLLRYTVSDCPFGIFKLFFQCMQNKMYGVLEGTFFKQHIQLFFHKICSYMFCINNVLIIYSAFQPSYIFNWALFEMSYRLQTDVLHNYKCTCVDLGSLFHISIFLSYVKVARMASRKT